MMYKKEMYYIVWHKMYIKNGTKPSEGDEDTGRILVKFMRLDDLNWHTDQLASFREATEGYLVSEIHLSNFGEPHHDAKGVC